MHRRTFMKIACCGAASSLVSSPVVRALAADAPAREGHFFVFVHASGGWDVTLWADPRNEKRGLIQPASTANTDTANIKRWVDAPLDEGARSFELVRPRGSNMVFGPGIGDLADLHDRLTVINGLAMNTVSHPDGTAFSATGRHLVGGRVPVASIDTLLANELGKEQTFPVVSVQFPSSYVGDNLDRRVVPLTVGSVSTLSRALTRSGLYDSEGERDEVTALLSREAAGIAQRSEYPDAMQGMSVQLEGLRTMLGAKLQDIFSVPGLQRAQPQFNYRARFATNTAVNSAFAVEAMKRNVVRCVSFSQGGFDTHNQNYRTQAQVQQELFDAMAVLVRTLDATPHPTLTGRKLADTTHILVISDFCRTPQINTGQGRDHYPNNSALVISPRFRGNTVFGASDKEQLLPAHAKRFVDGERAVAPPDLLATMLASVGVSPRKYMRDGEVIPELLV
jgi:hypothetical protein